VDLVAAVALSCTTSNIHLGRLHNPVMRQASCQAMLPLCNGILRLCHRPATYLLTHQLAVEEAV